MQVILKPRFWILWSWALVGLCVFASAVNIASANWQSLIISMTMLATNVALITFWKKQYD